MSVTPTSDIETTEAGAGSSPAGSGEASRTEPGPVAILYEHPAWFEPLFRALGERGIPHRRLRVRDHRSWDPGEPDREWSVLLNRMSPSAHLRGAGDALPYVRHYLAHVERRGGRVVNGARAFRFETSKADQISLMASLGIPHPETRMIRDPGDALRVAREVGFPIVVKPNVGGSGAGIRRYEEAGSLRADVDSDALELGPDGSALVQSFVPPAGGAIVRVEVLAERFLYAIRVPADGRTFDLCPADLCTGKDGGVGAPEVEAYDPPPSVVDAVERLTSEAGIEVGGVEYLVDPRDGRPLFYDVNALSNFVADAPEVVGFDPFDRLAAWLAEERAAVVAGRS